MTLAIDATSPAVVSVAGSGPSSVTTGSFTPPAGSLLVAIGLHAFTATEVFSDSHSSTWTKLEATGSTGALYGVIGVADATNSATTVTLTTTASDDIGLKVYVVTGAAARAAQAGAVYGNFGGTVAPSAVLTPTAIGSLLFAGLGNDLTVSLTGATGTTVDTTAFSGQTQWAHRTATVSALTSTTYGWTPTTATQYVVVGVEITPPSTGTNANAGLAAVALASPTASTTVKGSAGVANLTVSGLAASGTVKGSAGLSNVAISALVAGNSASTKAGVSNVTIASLTVATSISASAGISALTAAALAVIAGGSSSANSGIAAMTMAAWGANVPNPVIWTTGSIRSRWLTQSPQ